MKRIVAPMVGGVITSTILELIIYPAIYMIWLKDAACKDVRGAVMTVDFKRHTMLWMFTKKYNSWAQPHENNYHAILAIPAKGSRDVTINITHNGKKVSTQFKIDVK